MPTNKGRSALRTAYSAFTTDPPAPPAGGVQTLPLTAITRPRYQPRLIMNPEKLGELVDAIRESGVLQPIIVQIDPDDADKYQVVVGNRRRTAAEIAGLTEIPVIVRTFDEQEALIAVAQENLQREDLTVGDEGAMYEHMLVIGVAESRRALARALGISPSRIDRAITLADHDRLLAAIARGDLTINQALDIARDPDVAVLVAKGALSLPEALLRVANRKLQRAPTVDPADDPDDDDDGDLESILSPAGARAAAPSRAGRGRKPLLQEVSIWADKVNPRAMPIPERKTLLEEVGAARDSLIRLAERLVLQMDAPRDLLMRRMGGGDDGED